jgi:beta-N-acetylhexosaminidase
MEEGSDQDLRLDGMMLARGLATFGLVALAACTSTAGSGSLAPPSSSAATPSRAPSDASSTPTTTPARSTPQATTQAPLSTAPGPAPGTQQPVSPAQRIFAGMTERQRIGQLLMVDCSTSGISAATVQAIRRYHVGSVILDGTSTAGVHAIAALTSHLQSLAPSSVRLFVATDQEGGLVQRLQGPGFTRIVSAVQQGGIAPATLQGYAQGWGAELRRAGVNVNLAPVLDTVPAGFGSNPPIGDLDREYGHTPYAVRRHGLAVLRGMTAAGVDTTVKHFPGLGRVHGNTDTTSGVTDTVTTRHDAYLAPFQAAVVAGTPFVMMSTAIYSRIDPGVPAAFSGTVVTGMLRGDLGFRGLIISDDLGAARQVSAYPVGQRAVKFVHAGGDVVLTVDASQAATMTAALLRRAQTDPAFRKQVNAAALLVLQKKQARGLLS